jgi:hypothetical protein
MPGRVGAEAVAILTLLAAGCPTCGRAEAAGPPGALGLLDRMAQVCCCPPPWIELDLLGGVPIGTHLNLSHSKAHFALSRDFCYPDGQNGMGRGG